MTEITLDLQIEEPILLDVEEEKPLQINPSGNLAIVDFQINLDLALLYNISKL